MAPLRKAFLVLASAIVIATATKLEATNNLSNIKNVVVLVQENR